MMSARRVSTTSGTSANGMPKESTTCEITRLPVGGSPSSSTTSAGSMVSPRRTNNGIRRRMNPCMTTWPAYVPTLEEDSPEASRATANISAAPPPTTRPSPACAASIVSAWERPVRPASDAPRRHAHGGQVVGEPEEYDAEQATDRQLEAAVAALLQGQDREGVGPPAEQQ